MKIGIIGGSGLYKVEGIGQVKELKVETPLGKPSSSYFEVNNEEHTFYFLPRHGVKHQILPSEINHRANIMGFKQLGVETIIGISAVGSLQSEYRPKDVVLIDQYFDRTKASDRHTFFGRGIVGHVSLADPICDAARTYLANTLERVKQDLPAYDDIKIHNGGTYINMEGPAFSTRAESRTYRKLGFDVIGMTTLGEARLAREAEICYACMALVTDYDSWHEETEAVTAEMVIETLKANVLFANDFIQRLISSPPKIPSDCACRSALSSAIMTAVEDMPTDTRQELLPIIGKYV